MSHPWRRVLSTLIDHVRDLPDEELVLTGLHRGRYGQPHVLEAIGCIGGRIVRQTLLSHPHRGLHLATVNLTDLAGSDPIIDLSVEPADPELVVGFYDTPFGRSCILLGLPVFGRG